MGLVQSLQLPREAHIDPDLVEQGDRDTRTATASNNVTGQVVDHPTEHNKSSENTVLVPAQGVPNFGTCTHARPSWDQATAHSRYPVQLFGLVNFHYHP